MKKTIMNLFLLTMALTSGTLHAGEWDGPWGKDVCPPRQEIRTSISEVEILDNQHFCKTKEFQRAFLCDKISPFEDGTVLPGLKVKLFITYHDACHKPGACGPRACIPTAQALLDVPCDCSKN